jgi:DNA-binding MarR family transcriptional regulator
MSSAAPPDLALRLHAAAIHLLRAVKRVDAAMGLGPAQSSALSVLVFGGPRSPGALAAAEGVRPPSMTRVVRELEAAGLVRRKPDEHDRRAIRLEATAKADRILKEGRARRTALLVRPERPGRIDPHRARRRRPRREQGNGHNGGRDAEERRRIARGDAEEE